MPSEQACVRILHIEDDALVAELVQIKLQRLPVPCQITCAENRTAFEAALQKNTFDVIISDSQLPDFDTQDALAHIREHYPEVPFIFLSGTPKSRAKDEALRRGATDYVGKENLAELIPAIQRVCPKANRP